MHQIYVTYPNIIHVYRHKLSLEPIFLKALASFEIYLLNLLLVVLLLLLRFIKVIQVYGQVIFLLQYLQFLL